MNTRTPEFLERIRKYLDIPWQYRPPTKEEKDLIDEIAPLNIGLILFAEIDALRDQVNYLESKQTLESISVTKSYADECLERADKATEGPWTMAGITIERLEIASYGRGPCGVIHIASMNSRNVSSRETDAEFIAHARSDVPELARRLKKACEYLRACGYMVGNKYAAEELEAPLGEK